MQPKLQENFSAASARHVLSTQSYAIKASSGDNVFFWGLVFNWSWVALKQCEKIWGSECQNSHLISRFHTVCVISVHECLSKATLLFPPYLPSTLKEIPKTSCIATADWYSTRSSTCQNWSWNQELLGSRKTFYKFIFPPKCRLFHTPCEKHVFLNQQTTPKLRHIRYILPYSYAGKRHIPLLVLR